MTELEDVKIWPPDCTITTPVTAGWIKPIFVNDWERKRDQTYSFNGTLIGDPALTQFVTLIGLKRADIPRGKPPTAYGALCQALMKGRQRREIYARVDPRKPDTALAVVSKRYKEFGHGMVEDILRESLEEIGIPYRLNPGGDPYKTRWWNVYFSNIANDLSNREIEVGVHIRNSITRQSSLSIRPCVMVMICTNGMIMSEEIASFNFRHTEYLNTSIVTEALYDAISMGDMWAKMIETAKNTPIYAVDIAPLLDRFDISEKQKLKVLKPLYEDIYEKRNRPSLWEVINGVTSMIQGYCQNAQIKTQMRAAKVLYEMTTPKKEPMETCIV